MKKTILVSIIIIFLTATISSAFTTPSTLRCNHRLIFIGDRTFIVLKRCGVPIYKEIIRLGIIEPKIEHWVYGPIGGMYHYLIFKDGKLFKIESFRK